MNYFFIILPKLVSFFLLILMGYAVSRFGIVTEESLSSLSGLLIKLILPCLVISLLCENQTTFKDLLDYHRIILWQLAAYILMALAGILSSRMMGQQRLRANVHRGCIVGGNFGFVVIPLAMALFPDASGRQYIPICMAVDTTVVWTLGLFLFTRGREGTLRTIGKKLFNPILVSIAASLTLNSLHIRLSETVSCVVDMVGDVSYSMGLIYLGCAICFLKRPTAASLGQASCIVAVKMLLLPVLVYGLSGAFLPETERLMLMLIVAAPSMTTASMISRQYRLDEDYASTAVFISTMCCMVTIPLDFFLISLA